MLLQGWDGVRGWGLAVFIALSLFVPIKASAIVAAPVKLAWASSQDPNVIGYAVYYGTVGSGGASRLDVGASLQAVIPALRPNQPYFFYVVAYNSDGSESQPSNQIQYSPPILTRIQLKRMPSGVMRVQFRGPAGASCRVEYTTSLGSPNWQTLSANIAGSDGTVIVDDAGLAASPVRFYRAALP